MATYTTLIWNLYYIELIMIFHPYNLIGVGLSDAVFPKVRLTFQTESENHFQIPETRKSENAQWRLFAIFTCAHYIA